MVSELVNRQQFECVWFVFVLSVLVCFSEIEWPTQIYVIPVLPVFVFH